MEHVALTGHQVQLKPNPLHDDKVWRCLDPVCEWTFNEAEYLKGEPLEEIPAELVTDTGILDTGYAGKLPEKIPGKHRWIVMIVHVLTDQQGRDLIAGKIADGTAEQITWDHENRLGVNGPGCIDCEAPMHAVADQPCPADATEWRS